MHVDINKCKCCGECVINCPTRAVRLRDNIPLFADSCTACAACLRACPEGAISWEEPAEVGTLKCESCPVQCRIREGYTGACRRYVNSGGRLERTVALKSYADVAHVVGPDWAEVIRKPLITGIGAGSTYPDSRPAPHIVQSKVDGVDVVTVVTEAPLSYSGIKVKVDTDRTLGNEGAQLIYRKRKVGHLTTEEYGSKMLSIGGVNLMTGENGLAVARLVSDLANRERARVRIEGGSRLDIQVGRHPIIDGDEEKVMRVGCGSATLGLFSGLFVDVADEVIVLDSHLTGLMTEHVAGLHVGAKPSGVQLRFRRSTPGRYFGDRGNGWGGTSIVEPTDVIAAVDMSVARPGMTVLITETTGREAALFEVSTAGSLKRISVTPDAENAVRDLADTCQESMVSALYCGGSGGSARAGVTRYPIKLTRAVHQMKCRLTVGGAPAFVLPGGGINFMVDVGKVMPGAFTWVPTPATVCPIEYTMTLEDYLAMGGHREAMKPFGVGT